MDKDFRPETQIAVYERQGGVCACCGCNLEGCWPPASLHHMKRRSALTKADLEHGPGGGSRNAVYLCGKCHEMTHKNTPEGARFRTASWQMIGETEDGT